MERVQLGMHKRQVVKILGTAYTIAEKFVKERDTIEVLSYRNFPFGDEFYLFQFKNELLERWYKELQPCYDERQGQSQK